MPIVLPTHCFASQHVSTMEHSQPIQESCPTICSSNCLPSYPFFVVRCLHRCQAHVQAVALWAAFRHANNIVVKRAILLIFRHSHLLSVHRNVRFTVTACACALRIILPASSEQSSFLTKSTPIGNVQPHFLLSQSYAIPTPYAPVFPHRTVHKVGPSIVAWGDQKSPYLFKTPEQTSLVGRSLAVQEADYRL